MKTKPYFLKLIPYALLAMSIGYPVQVVILYGLSIFKIKYAFMLLTPLDTISMVLLMISSVFAFFMDRKIYGVIPVAASCIFINNIIVATTSRFYGPVEAGFATLLFIAILAPLYLESNEKLMYDKSMRWWKPAKRVMSASSIRIVTTRKGIFAKTLDISKSGLFIRISDQADIDDMMINQEIKVHILGMDNSLTASVVRKNSDQDFKGAGIALQLIKNKAYKDSYLPWLESTTPAALA